MTDHRIARVRETMTRKGLDALIVSSILNIRYMTGFTGSSALLIVKRDSVVFLSDIRYTLQAKKEVRNCTRIVITKIGLLEEASKQFLLHKQKVGFESQQVTYANYRGLRKLFPASSFVSTSNVVEDVMLVKDEREIETMRRAARISDRAFLQIIKMMRPDVRELELAAEISYLQKMFGAERDAFEIIVASGERSALPHARASDKKIQAGEMVTLDFGCVVSGYNSDLTRTIAVGRVSQQMKRVYAAVLDAQQYAIASVRAGMAAKDLDALARKRIVKHGFGKFFNHSLGHGIGLSVHERPKVSALSKEELQAGSVITIEPGVYLPNIGGVRIEDDVAVRENGCEVLNEAPKELVVV
jgi:Xaa-Pro aminopeptidase